MCILSMCMCILSILLACMYENAHHFIDATTLNAERQISCLCVHCMSLYACVCTAFVCCVWIYINTYIYICVDIYTYTYSYVCRYVCIYIHVFMYVYVCICMHIYTCKYTKISCLYVCIYIYRIYIYV